MNHYFTFDRINNERILSFYSRKPLDFGGAALEAEGRRKLIESIEADFGYKFRAVKQCTGDRAGGRPSHRPPRSRAGNPHGGLPERFPL